MSEASVDVVRQPIRPSADSHRRFEELLSLRFPAAWVALNRVVRGLPLRSRMRRFLMHRAVRMGVDAANRGDYEVAFLLFHRDVELNSPAGTVNLGTFPASLKGRQERIRSERSWRDGWDDFRYEPEELVDLKDRVLLLGRMIGSGPTSGAASDSEWAVLWTFSGGQVIREQVFFSRAEALKAVGLEE